MSIIVFCSVEKYCGPKTCLKNSWIVLELYLRFMKKIAGHPVKNNAVIFFIIEKAKEIVLDFLQGTVKVF